MKHLVFFVVLLLVSAGVSEAAVHAEEVDYEQGGVALRGYVAYDDSFGGRRPGVLVVHEWMGLEDYAKMRARQLAALGYLAFAADIYGKGVRPKDPAEAAEVSGRFRADPELLRARAKAALDVLLAHRLSDGRAVAIGYCFGGTTVLELARSGAGVLGVVSFHGGLGTKKPAQAGAIRASVLVLHGADDPNVPLPEAEAFIREMRTAGADWQMVFYGGAVHSFTNPASGDDPTRGVAYNERAERRSFEAMMAFLREIFGGQAAGPA